MCPWWAGWIGSKWAGQWPVVPLVKQWNFLKISCCCMLRIIFWKFHAPKKMYNFLHECLTWTLSMLRLVFWDLSWSDTMGSLRFNVKCKIFVFLRHVESQLIPQMKRLCFSPKILRSPHSKVALGFGMSSQNYFLKRSIFPKNSSYPVQRRDHIFQTSMFPPMLVETRRIQKVSKFFPPQNSQKK